MKALELYTHTHTSCLNDRESNIELYRIILMFFIVAHHYVVNSGVIDFMYSNPWSIKSVFLFIFGAWGKIGINCFMLITGYYMCKSKITVQKYLKILIEVFFYNILVFIFFIIFGIETLSIKNVIKYLLPIKSVKNMFTDCYLIFYLCIPYINVLINNMNKFKHLMLIILLFITFSILGNIPKFDVQFNYITLYTYIYLIGSFIRLYPSKIFDDKKITQNIMIVLIILCVVSIFVGIYFSNLLNQKIAYYFLNDANKLLAVITAISLFCYFKNIRINNNKIINIIASTTFGVLCIHANCDRMREFLWKTIFNNSTVFKNFKTSIVILHAVISVVIVYTICSLIDLCRKRFVEKNIFRLLNNRIEILNSKIENFFQNDN